VDTEYALYSIHHAQASTVMNNRQTKFEINTVQLFQKYSGVPKFKNRPRDLYPANFGWFVIYRLWLVMDNLRGQSTWQFCGACHGWRLPMFLL